jgi:hypothetical protein
MNLSSIYEEHFLNYIYLKGLAQAPLRVAEQVVKAAYVILVDSAVVVPLCSEFGASDNVRSSWAMRSTRRVSRIIAAGNAEDRKCAIS